MGGTETKGITIAGRRLNGEIGDFVEISARAVSFYAIRPNAKNFSGWLKAVKDDLTGKRKLTDYDKNTVPHIACLLLLAGF
jgi:hypothetical protein